jgi:3-phenylpropionate/trans-cinnamate dioxygenase ferredoxin reductase subunit
MGAAVVIIGGGQAGGQTAICLRQNGFEGTITVVGDESYVPYERPPLSKAYLAGDVPEERMFMRPAAFYAEKGIDLQHNKTITRIDRSAKRVHLAGGEVMPYTQLVLATGGRVRRLDCPGADLPGVHYLRNIDDVRGFREKLVAGIKLVIVGGGYIGLEVAAVAIKRGCAVTVLEAQPLVLNRVVAPEMSAFFTDVHRAAGVDIRTSAAVTAIEGNGKVEAVRTNNGRLAADVVIVGIGIVPNVELAAEAGLAVDGGIVVDDCARTDDPAIFAAGDCTNHPNAIVGGRVRLESVPNALSQGKTAALAMLGRPEPMVEVPWFWSDQYDLKLQIAGLAQPTDQIIIRGQMADRKFSACYLRSGIFVACQAVNTAKDFLQSKKLIAENARPDPARLADSSIALKDL